ncbi:MAG TPA: hypothetical protein VNF47_15030 [Streptosporangiaceae bacterium]|nr:hypothetical protein [Streptosporangiaceae bacterium]
MIACLLDDSAVLALGKGYPALSGLIVDAAAGRALLAVPALCLSAAEAQRPGISEHVGMLPVDIEPLELSAAIPAGRLIGDGVDWRIAQAVAAALPSAVHPDGRVVLSVETFRYQSTSIQPIDPSAAD